MYFSVCTHIDILNNLVPHLNVVVTPKTLTCLHGQIPKVSDKRLPKLVLLFF